MKEVIYVRGGMATTPTPEEHVWRFAHPRRSRSNTKLTLFDYMEKKRKHWNSWNGKQPPANQRGVRLLPDLVEDINSVHPDKPSAVNLYDYIKSIGDQRPGSVIELQFFTHGWQEGPILVNTFDSSPDPDIRDPDDQDTRNKDFRDPSVLGGLEGERFKKAFSSRAFVKFWGCAYIQSDREIITKKYMRAKNDEDKKRAKEAYQDRIQNAYYQFLFHKLIGIEVWSAPVGWGTSPFLPKGTARYRGIFPPRGRDLWWRVAPVFRRDKADKFYKNVLNAKIDALDYIAFTDKIVTASVDVPTETAEEQLARFPSQYPEEYPAT